MNKQKLHACIKRIHRNLSALSQKHTENGTNVSTEYVLQQKQHNAKKQQKKTNNKKTTTTTTTTKNIKPAVTAT